MIIPRPVKVHAHPGGGRVRLTRDGFVIATDEASRPVAGLLRAALEASTGWEIAVVPVSGEVGPNAVTLTAGLPESGLPVGGLPDDGYLLHAAPGEGVVIGNGGGPAGVFYAAQTLRLLLLRPRPCGMPRPTAGPPRSNFPPWISRTRRASAGGACTSTWPGTSSPRQDAPVHRPGRPAQAQRAAPAPDRRPGLAGGDPALPAADRGRRLAERADRAGRQTHGRRRARTAASTPATTCARSSPTPPSGTSRWSPRSTCPATRRRPSPPTPSSAT